MIYIYVGIALSMWFALAGVVAVFKPRARWYVTTVPISLAMTVGIFAGTIDDHFGYVHKTYTTHPSLNGLSFYEFLFMKNWAYSIFIICTAFTCYELAKLMTRKYKANHTTKRHVTTAEFMHDLPDIGVPAKSSEFDLF